MQPLQVHIGETDFKAALKEFSESRFLILDGNLFQVETALKSKVFTAKTLSYFLYNGKANV